MLEDVRIFDGEIMVDARGTISFSNAFDFKGVKRFYKIENFERSYVRAWRGHLKEAKYVYVVTGSLLLAVVALDNASQPNQKNPVRRFVLSGRKPCVVYLPPGYANGFRSLEDGTQVIFFSTSTLEESKADDYRYPPDYWGEEVWTVENG